MNRKRFLTESIEDFGKQIVNNVYDTLIQWNYDQGEIDSIVGRDSIELDIENGKCVLHCGNEIIYSTPSNVLIHKFAPAAEDALLNWCIKKIGREPDYIDADDLFYGIQESQTLNEVGETDLGRYMLGRLAQRHVERGQEDKYKEVRDYAIDKMTDAVYRADNPYWDGRGDEMHADYFKKRAVAKGIEKYKKQTNESKINKNMSKKITINEARRPANKQVGQHLFKGLRYDNNGNPLYTCDTLSNEEAQAMGWKFSPKYGLYGQLSDPTMFYESKKRSIKLTESDLKRVISESVKRVLKEDLAQYSTIPTEIRRNELIDDIIFSIDNVSRTLPELTSIKYSDNNAAQQIIKQAFDKLEQVSIEIEKLQNMVIE